MEVNYPLPQEAPQPPAPPLYNKFLERGREGKSDWWRYFLGVVLSFGVGYQVIGAAPLCILILRGVTMKFFTLGELLQNPNQMLNHEFLHVSTNVLLVCLLFIFVPAMCLLWVAVRFLHKRPFMSLISGVSNKFDFKRYFLAFGIWFALLSIQLFIALQMSPESFQYVLDPVPFFIGVFILIVFLPIQTGWEELFFRGYIMQWFAKKFKKSLWPWLLTSLLFGLVHIMNTEVKTNGILLMMPQYILPGLIFGAMALMDERLELPMGMHLANNLVGILAISSPDSSIKSNSIWAVDSMSSPTDAIFGSGLQLLALGILFLIYRWDIKKLYK